MDFFFSELQVTPLLSQSINDELLIAIPQRRHISSDFVVRFHFVDLPPLLGIDLLQQQTSHTQNRLVNKPNVFFITSHQEGREIVFLERLALPRAVAVFGVKAGTILLAQCPAAVWATEDE